jgi:hypothetical protein
MKPNDKVKVIWDCPMCGSRGGYGGPNKDLLVGLCVPVTEECEEIICLVCGWRGAPEDAEITAVEALR